MCFEFCIRVVPEISNISGEFSPCFTFIFFNSVHCCEYESKYFELYAILGVTISTEFYQSYAAYVLIYYVNKTCGPVACRNE